MFRMSAVLLLGFTVGLPADWKKNIDSSILKDAVDRDLSTRFAEGVFEGDIMGVDDTDPDSDLKNVRSAFTDPKIRWPGGVVPYSFSEKFDKKEKLFVAETLQDISTQTSRCITFVPHTTEQRFIQFVRGFSCFSYVGLRKNTQAVSLAPGCLERKGDAIHVLMHALGFWHENARNDRDDFVTVNMDNVPEDKKQEFSKYIDEANAGGISYDVESVVHYPFNVFAKDSALPTLVPKAKGTRIGQADGLSPLDIQKIKAAYECATGEAPDKATRARKVSKAAKKPGLSSNAARETYTKCVRGQKGILCPNHGIFTVCFSKSDCSSKTVTPEPETDRTTEEPVDSNSQEETPSIDLVTPDPPDQNTTEAPAPEVVLDRAFMIPFMKFQMKKITPEQCAALSTDNCKILKASGNCRDGAGLIAECTEKADNAEVRSFFEKIQRLNASRGLEITLKGRRDFDDDIFEPVRDILIILVISDFDGFSISMLRPLQLPLITHVQTTNCRDVTISQDDLLFFPKLTMIILKLSTVSAIEEGSYEGPKHLKQVTFDTGYDKLDTLDAGQRAHLKLLHCDCKYQWLRDYLAKKPYLIEERKTGEIHNFGGIISAAFGPRDAYIPVDCAKKNLVGPKSQKEFSVNSNCPNVQDLLLTEPKKG